EVAAAAKPKAGKAGRPLLRRPAAVPPAKQPPSQRSLSQFLTAKKGGGAPPAKAKASAEPKAKAKQKAKKKPAAAAPSTAEDAAAGADEAEPQQQAQTQHDKKSVAASQAPPAAEEDAEPQQQRQDAAPTEAEAAAEEPQAAPSDTFEAATDEAKDDYGRFTTGYDPPCPGPTCAKCGRDAESVRFRLAQKSANTWWCGSCNSKSSMVQRCYAHWPPRSFALMRKADQQAFWRSMDDPSIENNAQFEEELVRVLSVSRKERLTETKGGDWKPLSVWAQEGYDADAVRANNDVRYNSDLKQDCYRIRIEGSRQENIEETVRQELRQNRKPPRPSPPKHERAVEPLPQKTHRSPSGGYEGPTGAGRRSTSRSGDSDCSQNRQLKRGHSSSGDGADRFPSRGRKRSSRGRRADSRQKHRSSRGSRRADAKGRRSRSRRAHSKKEKARSRSRRAHSKKDKARSRSRRAHSKKDSRKTGRSQSREKQRSRSRNDHGKKGRDSRSRIRRERSEQKRVQKAIKDRKALAMKTLEKTGSWDVQLASLLDDEDCSRVPTWAVKNAKDSHKDLSKLREAAKTALEDPRASLPYEAKALEAALADAKTAVGGLRSAIEHASCSTAKKYSKKNTSKD
ncbi:unnamed protein product, partial [Prorocentrum cordatum]